MDGCVRRCLRQPTTCQAQAQLPALQQESERLSAILVSLRTKLDVERDRGRGLEAEVDCLRRQDVQRWVLATETLARLSELNFKCLDSDACLSVCLACLNIIIALTH